MMCVIAKKLEKHVHLKAEIPIRTPRRQESALGFIIHHKEAVRTVSADLELSLNGRQKPKRPSLWQLYFQPMVSSIFQTGHTTVNF